MKPYLPVALLATLILLSGCLPTSFSFTLGSTTREINETVIHKDPGSSKAKIAIIDVEGVIESGGSDGLFGSRNPVDGLVARLNKAADDPHTRAVILRINSPGGTVTASDIMHREVRRFRTTTGKPVVASFGEIAASGGYYLGLAADRIIAEPTSLTGSIGVIIPTVNVSDGLERIGIQSRAIKSGANKDLANPLEPMRESQYAVLQGIVDEFYATFRNLVIERRTGLHPEYVEEATDGRIVTGERAAAIGLVDATGGVRDAFEVAKELAELPAARLVKYHNFKGDVASAYAHAPPVRGVEVNMLQVRLDDPRLIGGRPYFLWTTD